MTAVEAEKSIKMTQRKDSKKKTNFVLIMLISILLIIAVFLNTNRRTDKSGNMDNLMEAVFRHQFAHNGSARQNGAYAYYLAICFNQDPSDEFIKRFENNRPPVMKISQSRMDDGLGQVVKDRKTGQEGTIFRITSIRFINDEMAEVKGGYYEASLSASGNTYQLIRIGRYWIVIKDICNWCS